MEHKSTKRYAMNRSITSLLLLFMSLQTAAKVNLNWKGLSQEQYIENLIECKTTLDEIKWSHNLWPKQNKTPKPKFTDVVDKNSIRQSVENSIKMQVLLQERFGLKITPKMLQDDMQRMANDTQNPDGLRELFANLNNDANTIAQCLSRQYLVNKLIAQKYYNSPELHKLTRAVAQTELDRFQQLHNVDNLSAHYQVIAYSLASSNSSKSHHRVIELSQDVFYQKLTELENPQLKQERNSFSYSKIKNQTSNSIEVETLTWQKQKLNTWLKSESANTQLVQSQEYDLSVPKIKSKSSSIDTKTGAINGDTWKRPYGIKLHTAIWTGSDMIIWGGYDGSYLNTGYKYNPSQNTWTTISSVNAPDARTYHKALWTGTDMIVWGGIGDNTGSLNSGGIYNALSDTWVATSLVSAPVARQDFTAVLTDSGEMLVWGGGNLNSGKFFNPTTNSWSAAIPTIGAPTGRSKHTAVWAGDKMIVWGGTDGVSILGDGGIYDPSTGWSTISTIGAALPRYDHTAIWGNNEMMIWGGLDLNGLVATGKKYSPQSDTWTTIQSANSPGGSIAHTAIWADDKMVTWGGEDYSGYRNTGGIYDPVLDTWTAVKTYGAPSSRKFHTAVWTGWQMIIWGGERSDGAYLDTGGRYVVTFGNNWERVSIPNTPQIPFPSAIWTGSEMIIWNYGLGSSYNPITDSWQDIQTTGSPFLRELHTAIWTGTEMIVWGGYGTPPTNTGGRYNPLNDSWVDTTLTNAPTGRYIHTAIWSGTEMIVWGGDDDSSYLDTGSRYNPQLDTWQATTTIGAPFARFNHTSIWGDGEMLVWGGRDDSGNRTNTGNKYNPQTDSWLPIDSIGAPVARDGHTAIWTGDEMIVFGGQGQAGVNDTLNSGSRYDPISDNWIALPNSSLTPRTGHSSIWTGQDMIVWGGVNRTSQIEPEGLKYNPQNNSWQTIQTIFEPSMRVYHTAIWTGTEMIVWGGLSSKSGAVQTRSVEQSFGGGGFWNLLTSMGIYYPYGYYEISGVLNNLLGDQVVLQNNLGDDLLLTNDGAFTFSNTILEGSDYAITVLTNPTSPNQTCTVSNGTGINITSNVSDVIVNCVTNTYLIGGTVTGMLAGSPNTMVLQNNNGDDLIINNDGSFVFSTPIDDETTYSVSVFLSPNSPIQNCTVVNGSGIVAGNDVVNVLIDCHDLIYKNGFE